jgi:hypothetical protein
MSFIIASRQLIVIALGIDASALPTLIVRQPLI